MDAEGTEQKGSRMKIKLGLSTIKELQMGKVSAAFDHELQHVVKDCMDRPDDKTARKVQLTIDVVPDTSDGVCDMVQASFTVKSSVPARKSRVYQLSAHASGAVLVNPESPEDIGQGTLDEVLSGNDDSDD